MMNILICGYGNIGRHLYDELREMSPAVYDPAFPEYRDPGKGHDVAFICVPTPALPDGSCDTSIVEEATRSVDAEIIVIKSAVPPLTAARLSRESGKRIVISPEYYGMTTHSRRDLGFVILGGAGEDCSRVAEIYSRIKPGGFRALFTSWETAELAKYMENCFLALKVTFCAEFAAVAETFGARYPELRELFIQDERVGASHTWVYPDHPYYDSHCLNKDIPAFVRFAEAAGAGAPLMDAVDRINRNAKRKRAAE